MAAGCIIHKGSFSNDGVCAKCRSCKHESFWMSEQDFKMGRFRCNGCIKTFKSVPKEKEVYVLWEGKWVDYYDLVKKPDIEEKLEKIEETHLAVCLTCGKEYEPVRASAKYCSSTCRVKASRAQ